MLSIYTDGFILAYCAAVAAIFGAVMGSFLNCAAWRAVHGESVLRGRSHCPACGHTLGARDLVPVFSWLFHRGKCRWCGGRVSVRYLVTELLCAVLTVLCLLRFDLTPLCVRNLIFLYCLFCLSLTDWESGEIPDGCLAVAAGAWLLALPFPWRGWAGAGLHVLAALVFGGGTLAVSLAMDRILKKESLGGGDIKLFAVVGLYLGLVGTLFALMLSCVLGLLLALILRRGKGNAFPFGPAIAAASAGMLLYGEPLINWYLSLF